MKDKALDTFSVILFGTGGIAILVLAWVQPMPVWERILTSLVGSVGLVGVLVRAPGFRSTPGKMGAGKRRLRLSLSLRRRRSRGV